MIYSYQKVSDQYSTHTLQVEFGQRWCELATIDGVTYTFVDGELPAQPEQIQVQCVAANDPILQTVRSNSRAVSVINQQVEDRIRSRYSLGDEIKMLRLAPSEETNHWKDWVESCRAWGREQKALIGL